MKEKSIFLTFAFHEELLSLFKANPISIALFPQKLFSNRFVFTSWYLWALCLSLFSGGSLRHLFVPPHLSIFYSSFCASVAGFSLIISVSTSVSAFSYFSRLLSLVPTFLSTRSLSSIQHFPSDGYTDFPVFKNTLFP